MVFPAGAGIANKVVAMLTSPWVITGLFCYSIGMVLWLFALRRMDLSLAYPFVAMSFVAVSVMSVVFLGETLPIVRIAGLGMIIGGLCLMAVSA